MTTPPEAIHLNLQVYPGPEADAEETDRQTRQLRKELLELEVESAELVRSGEIPEGAKTGEAVTLGALSLALLPNFLPKVMEFLQAWSLRGEGRMVKIKTQIGERSLELEYSPKTMTKDELQGVVELLTKALDQK